VELEDRADSLVETYSGGMRRRLDLACGLIHRPEVLFLDEPTLGLDVQTRHRIWEYIRRLKGEGVTVFLTTHYMEEADSLCDRLAIVDRGRVVALGSPGELKRELGPELIRLSLEPGEGRGEADLPSPEEILGVEGTVSVQRDGEAWTVATPDGPALLSPLLERLSLAGWRVKGLEMKRTTLEDVFLHFTGRSLRAEEGSGEKLALSLRRARRAGRQA
jgi:ABC-2 type transport system ATP-binding protein